MKSVNLNNFKNESNADIEYIDLEAYVPIIEEFDEASLDDDKELLKFVNCVKSIVRSSLEYKEYIHFLKDVKNMTYCSFFNNISNYDKKNKRYNNKIKLEIHHEPFALHDIVLTVINKFKHDNIQLNTLLIAEKVMELHYNNYVGLMSLSATVHHLCHNGKLFIPTDHVFAYEGIKEFVKEYKQFIPKDAIDRYHYKLSKTKEINNNDFEILKTKYRYLKVNGYDHISIKDFDEDFNSFKDCIANSTNRRSISIAI